MSDRNTEYDEIEILTEEEGIYHVSPLERQKRIKLIIAANIGNFLETFDFTVYSFFSGVIAHVFFRSEEGNEISAHLLSLSVFAVGFLMRPIGSFVIGSYADRHGRKSAMLLSILLMAFGSMLIVFTPPPSVIGFAAPVLIIVGRLFQGFSAGGEIGVSTTLLMESATYKKRVFFVSWQYIGQASSSLCGSLFASVLTSTLSEDQMLRWGWRLPFIFALLIIPVGFFVRAHIYETFSREKDSHVEERHPFLEIVKNHLLQFICAVITVVPSTLFIYIMIFFMPTYIDLVKVDLPIDRYFVSTSSSLVMIVSVLIGGLVGDRVTQRKQIVVSSLFFIFFSSFTVFLFSGNAFVFLSMLFITITVFGIVMPLQVLIISEGFPRCVRATAMSFSYGLGVTIFGSTAQIVILKLLDFSENHAMAPFWYLGPMLLIGSIGYIAFHEKRYI